MVGVYDDNRCMGDSRKEVGVYDDKRRMGNSRKAKLWGGGETAQHYSPPPPRPRTRLDTSRSFLSTLKPMLENAWKGFPFSN